MENGRRLIPYSLYLPEEMHIQLKSKAQNRQASSMVRDAITMILEGNDQYTAGYKQAARDILKIIESNHLLNCISYDNLSMSELVTNEIEELPRLK